MIKKKKSHHLRELTVNKDTLVKLLEDLGDASTFLKHMHTRVAGNYM